ncbi:MAG: hypothetical protein H6622_16135 [Halobacteriovoraceae bacterium]|nr:hypothetical protein [Halobacteriovoraceae bacterium]
MSLKEQILKNIQMNGFPLKSVSLPLEKMYEIADERNENLNNILSEFKAEGIEHEKTSEKIIFRSALKGFGPEGLQKVQEMMNKMDPEELRKIQEQVSQMSDEERQKLMEQARSMGLF